MYLAGCAEKHREVSRCFSAGIFETSSRIPNNFFMFFAKKIAIFLLLKNCNLLVIPVQKCENKYIYLQKCIIFE